MRHQTLSAVVPVNCYKTKLNNTGVTNYYSISIKRPRSKADLKEYLSVLRATFPDRGNGISYLRLVDKEVTFRKVPYKQVYSKVYTQHFSFLLIGITTPFWLVNNLIDVHSNNLRHIKEFIHWNIEGRF